MTYQSLDSINGGAGTDTLFVQMASTSNANVNLTPTRTSNVEIFEVSNTGTEGTGTLNLSQVSGVQGVTIAGSTANTTVSNISNAQVAMASTGTSANIEFSILNSALAGSNTVNLSVDGHSGNVIIRSTGTNDIEALSLEATGADSTIGDLAVGDSTAPTFSSMTLSGDGAIAIGTRASSTTSGSSTTYVAPITIGVTSFDGSQSTGGATVYFGAGNMTASGGAGNDVLNFSTTAGDVSVTGGAGNDTFVFGETILATARNTLDTADTVAGGEGLDTLQTLSAGLTGYVKPATPVISGIERLTVMDALAGDLTTSNVQSGITEVQLNAGATGSTRTVTFDTGIAATLRLNASAGSVGIALASAGTATTDSITIKNITSGTNVFNNQAITATGVETLILDGGTTTTRVGQTVAAIGATSGTTAVNFVGNNGFTLSGAVTAGSVNASGLTGTAALAMTTGQSGVTTITGSANADTLIGRSGLATTISGGAGNDSIVGGTAADSLDGGTGNDTITAGGGNDTVRAGEGDDTVITTGALTNLMTFDGGAGTQDTLVVSTASTEGLANTTNFEFLQLDAAISQDMAVFTGSTFTRLDVNATGTSTITNASSSLNTLRALNGSTVSFARLVNTSTDTLTVGAETAANTTITTLTVNNEDTLNIGQGAILDPANTLTIGTLNAVDVDTINITGAQNTAVTVSSSGSTTTGYGVGATARSITINASTATGTVNFVGNAASVYSQTITGSSTAANTLTGGSGNDVITGGNAGNVLSGEAGNDTITGGTANDTLSGGLGADVIDGGSGIDTYQTGAVNGVADGGTATIAGMVINLGSTTLTAAAINTATSLNTAGGNTSVASNTAAYLTSALGGDGLSANVDTLTSIENATGSGGTDYIVGSTGNNVLSGGSGNDTINGGAGNDTINGEAGDDRLIGGAGVDAIDGGSDTDTVDYSAATLLNGNTLATTDTGITLVLNTSTAATVTVGSTNVGADTVVNVENIIGTNGADTLTGDSAANNISGGTGNDTITGAAGNDALDGGSGIDTFIFADTAANNGADTFTALVAGASGDILDFSAFSIDNTSGGVAPGDNLLDPIATNPSSATVISGKIVRLVGDLDTATKVNTALVASGTFANLDMSNSTKAIIITSATDGTGDPDYVYYATSSAQGVITAVLVGTTNNIDIDTWVSGNFLI